MQKMMFITSKVMNFSLMVVCFLCGCGINWLFVQDETLLPELPRKEENAAARLAAGQAVVKKK